MCLSINLDWMDIKGNTPAINLKTYWNSSVLPTQMAHGNIYSAASATIQQR
jgi:hypothetical protein